MPFSQLREKFCCRSYNPRGIFSLHMCWCSCSALVWLQLPEQLADLDLEQLQGSGCSSRDMSGGSFWPLQRFDLRPDGAVNHQLLLLQTLRTC